MGEQGKADDKGEHKESERPDQLMSFHGDRLDLIGLWLAGEKSEVTDQIRTPGTGERGLLIQIPVRP